MTQKVYFEIPDKEHPHLVREYRVAIEDDEILNNNPNEHTFIDCIIEALLNE